MNGNLLCNLNTPPNSNAQPNHNLISAPCKKLRSVCPVKSCSRFSTLLEQMGHRIDSTKIPQWESCFIEAMLSNLVLHIRMLILMGTQLFHWVSLPLGKSIMTSIYPRAEETEKVSSVSIIQTNLLGINCNYIFCITESKPSHCSCSSQPLGTRLSVFNSQPLDIWSLTLRCLKVSKAWSLRKVDASGSSPIHKSYQKGIFRLSPILIGHTYWLPKHMFVS